MTTVDTAKRQLVDAILTVVRATSFKVGDGEAPNDSTYPYAVLYVLGVPEGDGDLAVIDRTGWLSIQITSVGATREQAAALDDSLHGLIAAAYTRPVDAVSAGYKLGPFRMGSLRGVVDRDDDVEPPCFYAMSSYEFHVAPA